MLQPLWNALDARVAPALAHGVLLAVSGGPDSRALLEAAARWPRRFAEATDRIAVASVDHGTRTESAGEADAVVARARALGFDAFVLAVRASSTSEHTLRDARYGALLHAAQQRSLAAVVTAHHAGDAAENALLSWLGRGGGGFSHGAVLRPFLELARSDLAMALWACGVDDAFVDPDAVSARADVRVRLLAPLRSARRDVEDRIARASARAGEDDAVLRAIAATHVRSVDGGAVIEGARDLPILRRALRLAITLAGSADPRASGPAVEIAARLMRDKRPGHVDAASSFVDVDADGNARVTARVADGPPSTHDGRAGRRLSGARPMRMVTE